MDIFSLFRPFAKKTRHPSRAATPLVVEALEGRVVPALTLVSNSFQQPYSAVIALEFTFPDGKSFIASGSLIDANSVLTAAHTMYSQVDGGWASSMTVWAGYNGGAYVAKTTATQFAVDPRYIYHEQNFDQNGGNYSEDGDIGVVTLKDAIGWTAGTFDIERADALFNFKNASRLSLSYPGESGYDGNYQYLTSGAISGYDSDGTTKLLAWNNYAANNGSGLTLEFGGQSGSPVFRIVGGKYYIDAVFIAATAAPNSQGFAVLLTDPVYNELNTWRTQDNTGTFSSGTNQYALFDVHAKVAGLIVHSDEYYSRVVTAAYQNYLGRAPDSTGLTFWIGRLHQGLSDEHLEAGFIGSPEYIAGHGGAGEGWVRGMYQDLLGRPADDAGLQSWLQSLAAGASPAQIAYGFAASAEREGERITADYTAYLGRPPESPGVVESWVTQFLAGKSNEDVIAGFVGSHEFYDAHGGNDTAWLRAVYLAVLERNPVQSEINAWLAVLQ